MGLYFFLALSDPSWKEWTILKIPLFIVLLILGVYLLKSFVDFDDSSAA